MNGHHVCNAGFTRKLLIGVFAFGTCAGFGSGFAAIGHCHQHRRAQLERHVAQVCIEAARSVDATSEGGATETEAESETQSEPRAPETKR